MEEIAYVLRCTNALVPFWGGEASSKMEAKSVSALTFNAPTSKIDIDPTRRRLRRRRVGSMPTFDVGAECSNRSVVASFCQTRGLRPRV